MTPLQAHELLAEAFANDPATVASWLPEGVELNHPQGVDPTVVVLTAAVELSGFLQDAETLADLRDGCRHFANLFSGEVITAQTWHHASFDVINALLQWGDAIDHRQRSRT